MKAISIKQPWASLISYGIKDRENRTWYTNFRGKLLIHASASPDNRFIRNDLSFLNNDQYDIIGEAMREHILKNMFYGAIIGEMEVTGCVLNSKSVWADHDQIKPIYNWQLEKAKVYDQPIVNVKGSLSLWEYEMPIIKQ